MPQASFTDLQNALNGFQDEVKNYAVSSAIADARTKVQNLQSAQLDEMDKRNQMQALSNDLALQLTGIGANGTQIQSAFSATAPKELQNSNAMFNEGLQKGSTSLQQKAQTLKDFEMQDRLRLAEIKNQQDTIRFAQKQATQNDPRYLKALELSQGAYNKSIKDAEQNIFKANIINDALKSKNPTALQNLAAQIRRQMGDVGPMTDVEQAKVEQINTLAGKIASLANYASGKSSITPQVQKNIQQLENQLLSANKTFKELMLRKHAYQLTKKSRVVGRNMDLTGAMQELDWFNQNEENTIIGAPITQPVMEQPTMSATLPAQNITTGATQNIYSNKKSKYIMD